MNYVITCNMRNISNTQYGVLVETLSTQSQQEEPFIEEKRSISTFTDKVTVLTLGLSRDLENILNTVDVTKLVERD